jgi:hypothetical protein
LISLVEVQFTRSGNYGTRYPLCAQQGRDRAWHHPAIYVADPPGLQVPAEILREMILEVQVQPILKQNTSSFAAATTRSGLLVKRSCGR